MGYLRIPSWGRDGVVVIGCRSWSRCAVGWKNRYRSVVVDNNILYCCIILYSANNNMQQWYACGAIRRSSKVFVIRPYCSYCRVIVECSAFWIRNTTIRIIFVTKCFLYSYTFDLFMVKNTSWVHNSIIRRFVRRKIGVRELECAIDHPQLANGVGCVSFVYAISLWF